MDRRKALRQTGLLSGAALLAPSLMMLLDACKETPRSDWKPAFLTDNEAKTISKLVDTILPRTDTPGALDMKVDLFLDKVFAETYDSLAQENLRREMDEFNADCVTAFGNAFLELDEENTKLCMEKMEAESPEFNQRVWGTVVGEQTPVPFYRKLKSMAIWAFFTSEKIGKEVLEYDPIPKEYDGCLPLADIDNRWSL